MNSGPFDPRGLHIAFIATRMPGMNTFQIRDLHAVLSLGVKVDLYLYETHSLDTTVREAIERNGGCVEQVAFAVNGRVARALLGALRRRPGQLMRDVSLGLTTLVTSPAEGIRTLAVLPAAIELGSRMQAPHVHALWAGVPATTAFWIARHSDRTFSLSAHAWDLLQRTRLLAQKVAASNKLVVCSAFAERTATARVGAALAERIQVVHHGLDLESWPDRGAIARPPRMHVVAVGRLAEKKGFRYLVEACGHLGDQDLDVTVEIIGPDGGMEESLKAEICRRKLARRVILAGPLPSSMVRERIGAAGVLCCPSIESPISSDGIPNVVLEAMALGTPVVATDAGGLAEVVVPGETGRVARQGDSLALADELAACWNDWNATQTMCRTARARMEAQFEGRSVALAFLAALEIPPSLRTAQVSPASGGR